MCSKIEQININDMFDRAMSIKENTVITYTDLKPNDFRDDTMLKSKTYLTKVLYFSKINANILLVIQPSQIRLAGVFFIKEW